MTRLLAAFFVLLTLSGCITIVPEKANRLPAATIDSILPERVSSGAPVTFTGHGTDPDGNIVGYKWRSDVDGMLSTKKSFRTSSLSSGEHTVYFQVQDDDGVWSKEVRRRITVIDEHVRPGTPATDSIKSVKIQVLRPGSGERYVKSEVIEFEAEVAGAPATDGKQLQWVSSIDGAIGTGPNLEIDSLSAGAHTIEVAGYGQKASTSVRVFPDLWELYRSPPSQQEIERIMNDFTIKWIDGPGMDEKWQSYKPFQFDQQSPDPSKLVAVARLDVLRHQRFAQPLPFTAGKTAYDHLRSHVHTLNLKLDCSYNTAGGGTVNLNRNFSVWDSRASGTPDNPGACKSPFSNPPALNRYISSLYLLLHEGRHCEPDDPGHTVCKGYSNMDKTLEGGSGHAQAALYLMWVYKYGLYDPPHVKQDARTIAQSILGSRFCTTPAHTSPAVQAILNELQ